MSNQPVHVTIHNLQHFGRTLGWLGKGSQWVNGNGTIDVDYEPWSCADRKQRVSILSELENRWVEFTLHILDANGEWQQIAYNPSLTESSNVPESPSDAAAAPSVRDIPEDKSDHIVVAGGGPEYAAMGFRSTVVRPPEGNVAKPNQDGFVVTNPGAPGVVAQAEPEKPQEPEEEATAEEAETPKEESALEPEVIAEQDIKAKVDRLLADKNWKEALQALIEYFGNEKVTFTTRALIANPSYDAIVAKYQLE